MSLSPRVAIALLALLVCSVPVAVGADSREDAPGAWLGVLLGKPGDNPYGDAAPDGVEGVPVRRVVIESPADKAGLRERDLILSINGTATGSTSAVLAQLHLEQPGNWVQMTVQRGDSERDVRVRLGERPSDRRKMRLRAARLGVETIELPPELREHFGAPREAGVMIARVEPGSPAEAAGFELGDVVFEIEEQPVGSGRVLSYLVEGGGVGNTLNFRVARYGAEMTLEAVLEEQPQDER